MGNNIALDVPAGVIGVTSMAEVRNLPDKVRNISLLVLESSEMDSALIVAKTLGEVLLHSEEEALVDLKVVSPEGDKWTVGELDEKVIAPSLFVPVEKHVIVVAAADMMDASAAEHLLKTVEEPSSATLFIFCVSNMAALIPTLQGRAGATVMLQSASLEDRIVMLVATGVKEAEAKEIVELAGSSASLLTAIGGADAAGRELLLKDLRLLGPSPLGTLKPVYKAEELTKALERLAVVSTGSGKVSTAKKVVLTPAARAKLRTILRERIKVWRLETSRILPAVSNAEKLDMVVRQLSALDKAEKELSSYAPANNVLAGLLARSSKTF